MQKFSKRQRETLEKIGGYIVCRIIAKSRHHDPGCYASGANGHYDIPLNAHTVTALVKKKALVQVDCPEKTRPPHSIYYRRSEP